MKFKEITTWPPKVTTGSGGSFAHAEMEDVITSFQKAGTKTDHLTFRLRKKDGLEYGLIIPIPANLIDKAAVIIAAYPNLTLGQLGELDIK